MNKLALSLSKSAGSIAIKLAIVVTAAVGGAGIVATNVFAALTATASNTNGGGVSTGTLKLQLAASTVPGITGGFTTPITGMAPGDLVNRYIDLVNTGSLDGSAPTLQIAASESNTLVTNPTTGLQVAITACTVAWTSSGTCSGTSSQVLAATSVSTLRTTANPLALPYVVAGGINRLKVSISLPLGSETTINGVLPAGTVQGLNNSLTWNFVIVERVPITTNN